MYYKLGYFVISWGENINNQRTDRIWRPQFLFIIWLVLIKQKTNQTDKTVASNSQN